VEKGGPRAAAGRGGHVWAVADEGLNSLLSFRNKAHLRATNGSAGQLVSPQEAKGRTHCASSMPAAMFCLIQWQLDSCCSSLSSDTLKLLKPPCSSHCY